MLHKTRGAWKNPSGLSEKKIIDQICFSVYSFTVSPTSGPAPLPVNFTNLSTGDFATCAWTFGDGGTSYDCGDPSHTYNAAGVYTVTLTASGLGGSDIEIKPSYIQVDHTIYLPLVMRGHQSTGLSPSRTPVLTNTNEASAIERLSALLPRWLALLFVLVSLGGDFMLRRWL